MIVPVPKQTYRCDFCGEPDLTSGWLYQTVGPIIITEASGLPPAIMDPVWFACTLCRACIEVGNIEELINRGADALVIRMGHPMEEYPRFRAQIGGLMEVFFRARIPDWCQRVQ